MRERDHFEYVGVDGRIVLKRTVKKQGGGVDWIDVAQNRDCLVPVNVLMNLRFR
jgi:hypothetical protein